MELKINNLQILPLSIKKYYFAKNFKTIIKRYPILLTNSNMSFLSSLIPSYTIRLFQ